MGELSAVKLQSVSISWAVIIYLVSFALMFIVEYLRQPDSILFWLWVASLSAFALASFLAVFSVINYAIVQEENRNSQVKGSLYFVGLCCIVFGVVNQFVAPRTSSFKQFYLINPLTYTGVAIFSVAAVINLTEIREIKQLAIKVKSTVRTMTFQSKCVSCSLFLFAVSFILMLTEELAPAQNKNMLLWLWIMSIVTFGLANTFGVIVLASFVIVGEKDRERGVKWCFYFVGIWCILSGITNEYLLPRNEYSLHYLINPLTYVGVAIFVVGIAVTIFESLKVRGLYEIFKDFRADKVNPTTPDNDLEMNSSTPKVEKVRTWAKRVIAAPNEYITASNKDGMQIIPHSAKLNRGTTYQIVDMARKTFEINLEARSKEMHPFTINTVWIVGPYLKNSEMFITFMEKTGGSPMNSEKLENIVRSIITGECRAVVGSMTLREIVLTEYKIKKKFMSVVQAELDKFGLEIESVNVGSLTDLPGNNHLDRLNKAEIENAKREDFRQEAQTRKEVAEEERAAKAAELDAVKAIIEDEIKIKQKQAELEAAQEAARIELERIRQSNQMSAKLEQQKAEHEFEVKRIHDLADAILHLRKQQAEAIKALAPAESLRIQSLRDASGNADFNQIMEYQKLADGRYENMARIGVQAVAAAPPTIHVSGVSGPGPLMIENVHSSTSTSQSNAATATSPANSEVRTPFGFPTLSPTNFSSRS